MVIVLSSAWEYKPSFSANNIGEPSVSNTGSPSVSNSLLLLLVEFLVIDFTVKDTES